MNQDGLAVIVRASGERTERACIHLLHQQLGREPIVVRERPFSRAVARTFSIGASCEAEWVVAVDADVLVLSNFFVRVRRMCDRMGDEAFCATALTLCRVVGGLVFRGVHLYRRSMLDAACSLLDEMSGELRPESAVQCAMAERGHEKRFLAHAVGVHDYEQSMRHLYLKAKLRARKDEERDAIASSLVSRASADTDALVSLWGFEDAAGELDAPAEYDWSAALPLLEERLADGGLAEREPFDIDRAEGYAERALAGHDYRGDRVTAPWIRERLRFDDGAPAIVDGLARVTR